MTLDLTGTAKKYKKKIILKNVIKKKINSYKNSSLIFELAKRGDYKNLNYTPTFKASAIFYVEYNKNINSKISFLNYWKLKNKNNDIGLLYTIRDELGITIFRDHIQIINFSYIFDLKKILTRLKIFNFKGTFEFEFFSTKDLKYSFPALQVFYETKNGYSSVHSNQRTFNNITDSLTNNSLNDLQTGFDIYYDKSHFSFLTFINGPLDLKKNKIEILIINNKGNKIKKSVTLNYLNKYQVIYLDIRKYISINFLLGKKGFCKVISPTKNVFNRIMVGTYSTDLKFSSVTHSYYDCSKTKDYLNYDLKNKKTYKCYLPFNIVKNTNLDLVFYPIYSKTKLSADLEITDNKTKKRKTIKNIFELKREEKTSRTININSYLKENERLNKSYCLNFKSINKKYPSRFTFGMNYRNNRLGSNISSSMLLNFEKNINKTTFWGPLIIGDGFESYIMLTHYNRQIDDNEKGNFNLKIYSNDKLLINKNFNSISPNSINLNINNLLKTHNSLIKQKNSEIIWYIIKVKNSNFICNHLHISKFGAVSADHSF